MAFEDIQDIDQSQQETPESNISTNSNPIIDIDAVEAQDPPTKAQKLYRNLIGAKKSDGTSKYTTDDIGSEDEFLTALSDSSKADKVYSKLIADGYTTDDLGDKNEFLSTFVSKKKNGGESSQDGMADAYPSKFRALSELPKDANGQPVPVTPEEDPNDLFKKAIEANTLRNTATSVSVSGGTGGAAVSKVVDQDNINQANNLKSQIEAAGYNADKLFEDAQGINPVYWKTPEYSPAKMLQYYKQNPQKYEIAISTAKWGSSVFNSINADENIDDQEKNRLKKLSLQYSSNIANRNQLGLDLEGVRGNVQSLVNIAKTVSGDKSEDVLSNMYTAFSPVYAGQKIDPADPLLTKLSPNQAIAYKLLEDLQPTEANRYKSVFIDNNDIADNYDAKVQKEIAGKRLEELGIQMKKNNTLWNINNYQQEYETLYGKVKDGTATQEEYNKALELEKQITPYKEAYTTLDDDEKNLSQKFPTATYLESRKVAQELVGQGTGGIVNILGKTGIGLLNTVKGGWNMIKTPFQSDVKNEIDQASLLGERAQIENVLYQTQETGFTKNIDYKLSPKLQKQIDAINADNSITQEEKIKKTTNLIYDNPSDVEAKPIEGGKSNISSTSLLYGLGNMAAGLAPFLLAEYATGGGATGAYASNFMRTFTAAALSSFNDEYAAAIERGSKNPYSDAMTSTAIHSAAMAGAGAPDAIRKMLGNKTAIGKLVDKLSDEQILTALRTEPKSLGLLNKTLNAAKNVTNVALEGTKEAGKFVAATTTGKIVNDAVMNDLKSPEEYTKEGMLELMNMSLFNTVLGTSRQLTKEGGITNTTSINKDAIHAAAQNPTLFLKLTSDKLNSGEYTPEKAKQISSNIMNANRVLASTPMLDANGDPLNQEQQRDLLFLKMQKIDAESLLQKDIPKDLASKLGDRIVALDEKMDKIYKGTYLEAKPTKKVPEPDMTVRKEVKPISDTEIIPTFKKASEFIPQEDLDAAQGTITKVNNAENINQDEIKKTEDILYTALDKHPEAAHLIEPLITKLQEHEFVTKTETVETTEKTPVEGTFGAKTKLEKRPALEASTGSETTVTLADGTTHTGTLKIKDGNYVVETEGKEPVVIGEKAMTDRDLTLPSEDRVPEPFKMDKDGNLESVTVQTKDGHTVEIKGDKALDIAIKMRADVVGEVPDAAFDKAYQEVVKTQKVEVPVEKPKVEKKEEVKTEVPQQKEGEPTGKPAKIKTASEKIKERRERKKQEQTQGTQTAPPPGRPQSDLPPQTHNSQTISSVDTKGYDETQKKVVEDAGKVLKSINNVVREISGKNAEVVIHSNDESFRKAAEEASGKKQDQLAAKGFYFSPEGIIHLNMPRVTPETMKHEGFHPLLDFMAIHRPEIINQFHNQLKGIEGGQKIIDDANRIYKGSSETTIKKEAITDFVAKVADGSIKLDKTNFEKVKDFFKAILSKLGINIGKDINSIKDLQDLAKEVSQKFAKGEEIKYKNKTRVGDIEGRKPQYQAEKLMTGEEEHPAFKNLTDVANWIGKWSKKNRLFKGDLTGVSDKKFVEKLVDHTKKELQAWETVNDGYQGFYDEDIPQTLNPKLVDWAKKTHGRDLTNEEISLYHVLSSFASPSATPVFDSNIGLQIFDRYLRTGELSPYTDKQATVWSTDNKGKRYDTGELKFDSEGKPVMSQIARAYATESLEKFNKVVGHFDGDIKKAIKWIESQHSYEELSNVMGTPLKGTKSLSAHENLTKENGGFGVFAISGPKLGSYILNRVGEYSTVTKDLWYARTMARLFGEPLIDKNGEVLKNPWATTVEGNRRRKLADEAWNQVAKELNTSPAVIQQRVWDFEKKLWQKLGAESSAPGMASEGFEKGVETLAKKQETQFSKEEKIETNAKQEERKVNAEGVQYNGKDAIGSRTRTESDTNNARNEAKEKIKDPEKNASLKAANSYNQEAGLPEVTTHKYKPSDPVQQAKIAKLYPKLQDVNSPDYKETDLERKIFSDYKQKFPKIIEQYDIKDYKDLTHKAYSQLIEETQNQYDRLPVKVTFHENGEGNYENNFEMLDDVHNFNHLWVYKGGDDHTELGSKTRDKNDLTANDKFRAVHDYYGHSVEGYQFGKDGEENAWIEHSKMFSPLAQWALSSETRGQNSWVNYSGVNDQVLSDIKKGSALKKEGKKIGDEEMVKAGEDLLSTVYDKFVFAQQKAMLLPPEFTDISKFHEKTIKEVPKQLLTYDKENKSRIPSSIRVGGEPVKAQSVKGRGTQETSGGRVLQAQGAGGEGKGIESKVGEEVTPKQKASDILSKYEKGSNIDSNELVSDEKTSDPVIKSVLDNFKKEFPNIKISGKRPSEGAAFYDTKNKSIDVNKNSTHWQEVESGQLSNALAHEYTHHLIENSEKKKEIENTLADIKEDLKNNMPEGMTKEQSNAYKFMIEATNSPQEILTYAVSNPEVRTILSKYAKNLNIVSNEVIGKDIIPTEDKTQLSKVDESDLNEMKGILKEYTNQGYSLDDVKEIMRDEFGEDYDVEEPVIEQAYHDLTTTGIKKEITTKERAERDLEPVEIEAKRSFGKAFDNAKKMVDNEEINPAVFAAQIAAKPRPLSAEESVVLLMDRMKISKDYGMLTDQMIDAQRKGDEMTAQVLQSQLDVLEQRMQINDDAARKSGYEQGLGLAARKMLINRDYSLATQLQRMKAANGGEDIPAEKRTQLQELVRKLNEANQRIEELEKKNLANQAQKEIAKTKKVSKSPEEVTKERTSLKKKIIDAWKSLASKSKSETGEGKVLFSKEEPITPEKQAQLESITKDVKDLVKSYAEAGNTNLKSIIDDIHADVSSVLPELTRKDIEDVVIGKYSKEPVKTPLTPEQIQAMANVKKVQTQIDLMKDQFKLDQRSKGEVAMDYLHGWHRLAILSGIPSLGKIATAATMRGVTSRLEGVIGQGLSYIPGIRGIAKGAEREGRLSPKAEAKAFTTWFDKMTIQDMKQVLKTGVGELDYLYGDKKEFAPKVPHWMEFFGRMHAAMKLLPKRAEFFRSLEMRTENAIKKGLDPMDPIVQQELAVGAYNDALRAVFMQDNYITDWYKAGVEKLEKSKIQGAKEVANALKFIFPIVKVPTNYVAEASSYMIGSVKALYALKNGVSKMTPEQKDYFMRALKKQSIGAAFMFLGYLNPQALGGYYSGKRKEGDLEAGEIELFGKKLPHWMSHSPLLEMLQVGATIRRSSDAEVLKGNEPSIVKGIPTVFKNVIKEIPLFGGAARIEESFQNGDKFTDYLAGLGTGIGEPQLLQNISDWTDTEEGKSIKRLPSGIVEKFMEGTPLRNRLEAKKELFTKEEMQDENFNLLQEKGVEIPFIRERRKIKVIQDESHPDGIMSKEEYDTYAEKLNKNVKSGIDEVLNTQYQIKEGNDYSYKMGKDLEGKDLESKVKDKEGDISSKILEEMGISPKSKRQVTKLD